MHQMLERSSTDLPYRVSVQQQFHQIRVGWKRLGRYLLDQVLGEVQLHQTHQADESSRRDTTDVRSTQVEPLQIDQTQGMKALWEETDQMIVRQIQHLGLLPGALGQPLQVPVGALHPLFAAFPFARAHARAALHQWGRPW